MVFLVDSHCHLGHPRLEGRVPAIVERAEKAGVERAVTAGGDLESNQKALAIAAAHPGFARCVIGLSPHDALKGSLEANMELVRQNAGKIAGIGEIGLDRHHFKKPDEWNRQEEVFTAQLELAEKLSLPAIIHSRDAEQRVLQILEGFKGTVVMHCFMKAGLAAECANRGYLVSVPTVDCPERLDTIQKTPLENLLCETDSPFLWKNGANEPANVRTVYEAVARAKGVAVNKAAGQIFSNGVKGPLGPRKADSSDLWQAMVGKMTGNVLDNLIRDLTGRKKEEKSIACFVDGPNMLRKELGVDLDSVKKRLQKHGKLKVAKVFLDQYASDKLIEAVTNQGFEAQIVPSDVDVALAVDAMQSVFNEHVDTIAVVSRDSDFKPLLMRAKEKGKETIVVGTEPDFSTALKNTADVVIDLKA
jgi:uncharacterized protein (TIGR00288 family)